MWAILPGLPFPLWNQSLLEGVGNTIGRFVALEDDFMNSYDKRKAKILIELDITKGLSAEVEILCHDRLFVQRLDFQGIPFRCNVCRETGHLQCDCPSFRKRVVKRSLTDSFINTPLISPSEDCSTPVQNVSSTAQLKNAITLFGEVSDLDLDIIDSVISSKKILLSHVIFLWKLIL